MIKKIFFIAVLFSLLLTPLSKLQAQVNITDTEDLSFNSSSMPQWARDLRRFDIIAFGTFPFTVMFTTIFYDMYLRNNPIGFTGNYYKNVLLIAGGASLTLALIDIVITVVKRNNERRRLESRETGSYEIERIPYEPDTED